MEKIVEQAKIDAEQAKIDGLNAAMNIFGKFKPGKVQESQCTPQLFQEFGEFLIKSDSHYSCGTVMQYISDTFNTLKKGFLL